MVKKIVIILIEKPIQFWVVKAVPTKCCGQTLAEIAENQRIEEENRRMEEWEKKFDEQQRLKEEELVKKFYSDEIPKQENNQDENNSETKNEYDNSKN